MTRVKICGITNVQDALAAAEAGADAIGFNFYPESPRYIDPEEAREIQLEIPSRIWKVGVFVDAAPDDVRAVAQMIELDYLQFHGDETPYYCEQFEVPYWKAFRLRDERTLALMEKYHPEAYLVDAYHPDLRGGTGQRANWDLAAQAKKYGKIILAGGISCDNVEEAIVRLHPWGIDICSGVEMRPGVKDPEAMTALIERAKSLLDEESA